MPRSASNAKPTKVQKICTLWTHDDNFSREDIVFNADKFTEIHTSPGTLLQIVTIDSGTAVRDFQVDAKATQANTSQSKAGTRSKEAAGAGHHGAGRRGFITITIDENGSTIPGGRDIDVEKAYVFAVAALPADLKSKHANLQVGWPNDYRNELTVGRFPSQKESRKSLGSAIVCKPLWLRCGIAILSRACRC